MDTEMKAEANMKYDRDQNFGTTYGTYLVDITDEHGHSRFHLHYIKIRLFNFGNFKMKSNYLPCKLDSALLLATVISIL